MNGSLYVYLWVPALYPDCSKFGKTLVAPGHNPLKCAMNRAKSYVRCHPELGEGFTMVQLWDVTDYADTTGANYNSIDTHILKEIGLEKSASSGSTELHSIDSEHFIKMVDDFLRKSVVGLPTIPPPQTEVGDITGDTSAVRAGRNIGRFICTNPIWSLLFTVVFLSLFIPNTQKSVTEEVPVKKVVTQKTENVIKPTPVPATKKNQSEQSVRNTEILERPNVKLTVEQPTVSENIVPILDMHQRGEFIRKYILDNFSCVFDKPNNFWYAYYINKAKIEIIENHEGIVGKLLFVFTISPWNEKTTNQINTTIVGIEGYVDSEEIKIVSWEEVYTKGGKKFFKQITP